MGESVCMKKQPLTLNAISRCGELVWCWLFGNRMLIMFLERASTPFYSACPRKLTVLKQAHLRRRPTITSMMHFCCIFFLSKGNRLKWLRTCERPVSPRWLRFIRSPARCCVAYTLASFARYLVSLFFAQDQCTVHIGYQNVCCTPSDAFTPRGCD